MNPSPRSVGTLVGALASLSGEANLADLLEVVKGDSTEWSDIEANLAWLEEAGLVEQVGPSRWRLTPDAVDATGLRQNKETTADSQDTTEHHLRVIADWGAATRGTPNALEAIEAIGTSEAPLPARVFRAVRSIAAIGGDPDCEDYRLDRVFEQLESLRGFEIFRRRQLCEGKPTTLAELGTELQVTRERVRQLQNTFEKCLKQSVVDNPDSPLWSAAMRLRARLGPLTRPERVDDVIADLWTGSRQVLDIPHRRELLLRLAGPYEYEEVGGWLAHPGFLRQMEGVVDLATEAGATELSTVIDELVEIGGPRNYSEHWLEDAKQWRVLDGMVVRWGKSLQDKGVAILELRGEPMTPEEIFGLIAEERSFRSFTNQLQSDERVMRRGRKLYGLRKWGGEEYTTVVDEMVQELTRRGGKAELEGLAQDLASRFDISANSVRMYAQGGAQFHLSDDGLVSINEGPAIAPDTAPLGLTRCCFRLPQGWAYRREVDHDILRGSGSGLPLGFAKELGLLPGEKLKLVGPYGILHVSWPSHTAHMGSLRKAAVAEELVEGDYLFVVACGGGRIEIQHSRRGELESYEGLKRLCAECGLEESLTPLKSVADAVDLEGEISTAKVRARLIKRGERDLANLVPVSSIDPDSALDSLTSLGE